MTSAEDYIETAASALYERDYGEGDVPAEVPWESLSEAEKNIWRSAVSD